VGRLPAVIGSINPPYLIDNAGYSSLMHFVDPRFSSIRAFMPARGSLRGSDFTGFPGGSFFPKRFHPATIGTGAGCRKIYHKNARNEV